MKQNRNTQQKQLIHDLIHQNHDHPTVDEVYELARQVNPTISRGTVYRNLNTLAQSNEIRRLSMPAGPDHYDYKGDDNYHFFCRSCQKVFDTPIEYDNKFNDASREFPGFQTEWHQLTIVGLCPKCNASRQP